MHKQMPKIVHQTLTFKIRHFMARPCRADSQRHVFNTVEFQHNDIRICLTFQIRDQSHASKSSITSLMVCNSFTCFPACDVVHFIWTFIHREQRSASTWDKDFVNVSDRFSLVGTLSTFKRPSCTACCSHKKRTSTCRGFPNPCRADMLLAALLSQRMRISHPTP